MNEVNSSKKNPALNSASAVLAGLYQASEDMEIMEQKNEKWLDCSMVRWLGLLFVKPTI